MQRLEPSFFSDTISYIKDKKKILEGALFGKVGATTLRFLELLVDKKRFDLLAMAAVNYGRLAVDKRGAVKAVARTARPLSSEERKYLAAKLHIFSGKDIELDVKEDPELIGGITVKIGDWVLDSSLRGQLRRLLDAIKISAAASVPGPQGPGRESLHDYGH